jgi:hypothetical protein
MSDSSILLIHPVDRRPAAMSRPAPGDVQVRPPHAGVGVGGDQLLCPVGIDAVHVDQVDHDVRRSPQLLVDPQPQQPSRRAAQPSGGPDDHRLRARCVQVDVGVRCGLHGERG